MDIKCPQCGQLATPSIPTGWARCMNTNCTCYAFNIPPVNPDVELYRDAFAELLLLQYRTGCTGEQLRNQAIKYQQMRKDRIELDKSLQERLEP